MLLIITSCYEFLCVSTSMTLSYLEPAKCGVLVNFSRFWTVTHITRVNCAEMAGDRSRQPACEFSALNVDFSSPNPHPLSSRRPAHTGVKEG